MSQAIVEQASALPLAAKKELMEVEREEPNAELKVQRPASSQQLGSAVVFKSQEKGPRDFNITKMNQLRMIKTQECLKKLKNEPTTFSHVKPEYFVNLSAFPSDFNNEDEALYTYNDLGIWHKIQFKFGYKKRTEQGFLTGFSLVCAKNSSRPFAKIDQGQQVFDYGTMCCPVVVRFKWRRDKNKYYRTPRSIMHHTHKLEIRNNQNINNKNVQKEIQMFVECNIPVAQIHALVNEKFSMNVSFEQIFHISLSIQSSIKKETRSDLQQLISLLEEQKRRDPELKYAYEFEDGNPKNDIEQLIVQTSTMRRNYQLYHDVVFMDATYKTNANQLALTVFSGVNNEGRNIVLGFALVKRETLETYKWLLKNLMHFNQNEEPGVILTDFDPSMSGAIEQSFRETTHLLCQWHMQSNFKKHFIFLTKKKSFEARVLYKFIVFDQIYTQDPHRFQKIQDIIFQKKEVLGEDKLSYLRKMSTIKEKWASAFAPDIFIAGIHTISRAESVNSQIKARVHSRSTLVEIFQMMMELENRVIERLQGEQRNDQALMVNHPLMEEVYQVYTKHAFEHMLYQYMLSHVGKVIGERRVRLGLEKGNWGVKDKIVRQKFNVAIIEIGAQDYLSPFASSLFDIECNCKFFQNYRMLCSHIFSVMNVLQVKSIESVRPFERWTKRVQWENYASFDLGIAPLDLQVQRRIQDLEAKQLQQFHLGIPRDIGRGLGELERERELKGDWSLGQIRGDAIMDRSVEEEEIDDRSLFMETQSVQEDTNGKQWKGKEELDGGDISQLDYSQSTAADTIPNSLFTGLSTALINQDSDCEKAPRPIFTTSSLRQ